MTSDRIVITGLGVVSAIGATREAFFAALSTGTSAIAKAEEGSASDRGSGIALAARIGDFGARSILDPRSLRRLPRLSQLVHVAAREALVQAAPGESYAKERVGVVLGTGLGTMRETMDFVRGYIAGGPEAASPMLFPSSVMNAAAGQMAIELGLRGANTTINHREASALDALSVAVDLIRMDRVDAVLVGAVDELSDVMELGYEKLARLSKTGLRPYARERDGSVLGEGASVMYLEREDRARGRGARVLAAVTGWASLGENRPRVGFGDSFAQAETVMREAISDAGLSVSAIDYVAGSGTGLSSLDALEARALSSVFGDLERPVAVSSILGQTGDFMSSSSLRIAQALFAIERQMLPGTTGCGTPDPDVPMPGLVREPRFAEVTHVLVPSLAQGGSNVALVLSR